MLTSFPSAIKVDETESGGLRIDLRRHHFGGKVDGHKGSMFTRSGVVLILFAPVMIVIFITKPRALIDLMLGADVLELENGRLCRFVRLWGRYRACAGVDLRTLSRLIVGGTNPFRSSTPRPNHSIVADLYAEVEGGKLVLVATAYPKHWLLSIARELARRARAHTEHAIRVVDRSLWRKERQEVTDPPTGCAIDLEHVNEVRLTLPQRETTKEDLGQLVGGVLFFSAGVFFLLVIS